MTQASNYGSWKPGTTADGIFGGEGSEQGIIGSYVRHGEYRRRDEWHSHIENVIVDEINEGGVSAQGGGRSPEI
jgi:hypothetical protein